MPRFSVAINPKNSATFSALIVPLSSKVFSTLRLIRPNGVAIEVFLPLKSMPSLKHSSSKSANVVPSSRSQISSTAASAMTKKRLYAARSKPRSMKR